MTPSLTVDALGQRVRIEFDAEVTAAQREEVARSWAGALSTEQRHADLTVLFHLGGGFEQAMERLTVQVTLTALDARQGEAFLFHAAGVADDQGRVAAFVGPSGRGKTTLSRALGRSHGYVSDETIAADPDLLVHPYRKPLSLVRPGSPKKQLSVPDAGLRDLPSGPLRLAALVLMDRVDHLETPEVAHVDLIDALPELVEQMSYLRSLSSPLQSLARLCDALGGVRRVRYAEAETVAPLLPEILDGAAQNSPWSAPVAASPDAPFDVTAADDALITGDTVAVLAGDTLQILGGVAPVIWHAAARGADFDEITATVVQEFGEPGDSDARSLVSAAIDQLVTAGVLRRR